MYASLYFLRQIESDLFYKVFGVNLTSFNTLIVVQTTSIFLVMLVPVGILTAVAERVNEFKRLMDVHKCGVHHVKQHLTGIH